MIYRVSGVVEAPDGSTYEPLYWGDLASARRVLLAIRDGAIDRGDGFELVIDQGPGSAPVVKHYRPVPAYAVGRAAFAIVEVER